MALLTGLLPGIRTGLGDGDMRLNVAGKYWLWFDGYGRLCLKTTQALIRAGHEVYPFEIDEITEKPAWYLQARGLNFDRTTIQLVPPVCMQNLPGRSIAYTMHESDTLPEGWAKTVNETCSHMIAPSTFMKEVYEKNFVTVPIEVVKGAIDPDECTLVAPNPHRPYTFGCLADRADRKGWDLVYSAFYKAFDRNDRNVRLIIKCRPNSPHSLPRYNAALTRDDRLHVWKADVQNLADIYAQMDAYIFPTRCEGLGMPPLEAAACGVPTVVTRWSGTADDADFWATPLEKFTLFESKMEGSGGTWAQPDLDEIVWRMRDMVANQDEYRQRALQSARWLRQNRTYAHAAKRIVELISGWFGVPPAVEEESLYELTFEFPELAGIPFGENGMRSVTG